MIKSMIAGASALMLTASPVLAATANPASSLSVKSSVRAAAPSRRDSKLAGPGAIVGLVLAAAVIAGGIYLVVDDDDSDSN
ncbi:hypothetical protein [Sphingomonas mollis]|uniref:Transmembrane protein n=1 Tax=Sphingomonas mollis TaxID=2795726 RepID=A0ABS0XPB5_9SPHN|nr:hypothetical protein [Sphingomonas sp. BT553]MBJ6121887.1 hypothetical protein [Sphingomonas sp. BT553]